MWGHTKIALKHMGQCCLLLPMSTIIIMQLTTDKVCGKLLWILRNTLEFPEARVIQLLLLETSYRRSKKSVGQSSPHK